jgi:3-deoxy-D-manno-octulosonic-acid transferase
MLLLYTYLTYLSGPILRALLYLRVFKGKEDKTRLNERLGESNLKRSKGFLIWIHAASVGETQSALILIEKLSAQFPKTNFIVTSGTKTSAALMAKRLPDNATHQYNPLDHPLWVRNFLLHWEPDLALWMESELWPNMLLQLKERNIPAALINARLSERSFKNWSILKNAAQNMLSSFSIILAQTEKDGKRFTALGAQNVIVTDNLKYSAAPLPYDNQDLKNLSAAIGKRPTWVYASSHEGEEELATRLHKDLKETYPELLTIIVPRHPERRDHIVSQLKVMGASTNLRGDNKTLPDTNTEIYIADTLGELGLFYALTDIAVIGRSFSHDGGGGHNPIEAAQLNCAVFTGPNIQYQTQLFNDMFQAEAAKQVQDEASLLKTLKTLLGNDKTRNELINKAQAFAKTKSDIVNNVIKHVLPLIPQEEQKP